MQKQLFMVAILMLFTTAATLADDGKPAADDKKESTSTAPADKRWELQEGPQGPILKEVEKLRKELGPEYSIESKELGIERDHADSNSSKSEPPGEAWSGAKLYEEVRALVNKFRQDARHLEEMAAHAEQLSDFALADQLREMAHRQWEAARELSKPRSTRGYNAPSPPSRNAPYVPRGPGNQPHRVPYESKPPTAESPAESGPAYGVPSAPSPRFNVPSPKAPKL